jgi:hypothetical protein
MSPQVLDASEWISKHAREMRVNTQINISMSEHNINTSMNNVGEDMGDVMIAFDGDDDDEEEEEIDEKDGDICNSDKC